MWVEEGDAEHEFNEMISSWYSNEYLLFIQERTFLPREIEKCAPAQNS